MFHYHWFEIHCLNLVGYLKWTHQTIIIYGFIPYAYNSEKLFTSSSIFLGGIYSPYSTPMISSDSNCNLIWSHTSKDEHLKANYMDWWFCNWIEISKTQFMLFLAINWLSRWRLLIIFYTERRMILWNTMSALHSYYAWYA